MSLRFAPVAFAGLGALAASSFLAPGDARACGGFFTAPSQTQTAVVAGHRMAFAITSSRTILWDQIRYSGAPTDFAWVLPVKPGAYVEASTDAWFEALDAVTTVQVSSPEVDCSTPTSGGCSFGCGSAAGAGGLGGAGVPSPVTVVHEGTVGPYETVTLHADAPGALPAWLGAHGYAVDASAKPIIDAYTAQGFDFIALRLQPGKGIQQMKPVRITAPGASPTLPLRMTAAGAGPEVALTLFVIGEGRYEIENFPNATVPADQLVWDFDAKGSNYEALRQTALAADSGRTWVTVFSKQGALLSQLTPANAAGPVSYQLGTGSTPAAHTLEQLYFAQGVANGEAGLASCPAPADLSTSTDYVSPTCPTGGGAGGGSGVGGSGFGGSGGFDGSAGGAGGAGTGGAAGGGSGGAAGASSSSTSGGTGGATGSGTGGGNSGPCAEAGLATDPSAFVCGKLDDLAAAMTYERPVSAWVTRLEAKLPFAALSVDLNLQAATGQQPQENHLLAPGSKGSACDSATAALGPATEGAPRRIHTGGARSRGAMFFAIGATLFGTFARRRRRGAR